jgi:hypothetical protein
MRSRSALRTAGETGNAMNSGASRPAAAGNLPAWPERPNQWAHSAVNLDTGRVITTVLQGPPTAEARAEALSRLGLASDVSPLRERRLQSLSVRTPYQASPLAWLHGEGIDLFLPDIDTPTGPGDGQLLFRPPTGWTPTPADDRRLFFFFWQLRLGVAPRNVLLSMRLFGVPSIGEQGHVSVGFAHETGPITTQVRVALPEPEGVLWLDVPYSVDTQRAPFFFLNIEAGVAEIIFHSATISLPLPVVPRGPTPRD